jgi:anaerobic ribonucleoside-triphosphate reductase
MSISPSLEELVEDRRKKPIRAILKRGSTSEMVEFDLSKIANAVKKASIASGMNYDDSATTKFSEDVLARLESVQEVFPHSQRSIPQTEDIEDAVFQVFDNYNAKLIADEFSKRTSISETESLKISNELLKGLDHTGAFYMRYRDARAEVRRRLVNLPFEMKFDTTDTQLNIQNVQGAVKNSFFNREALLSLILEKTPVTYSDAISAVKGVEEVLAQRKATTQIGVEEITAIIDAKLLERGNSPKDLLTGDRLHITISDIEQMMYSKSVENSNIKSNNPEAVNLGIAELALKEMALRRIYSEEVSEAHKRGQIHIHDLGYPDRVYCSAHSIEYLKEYGLDKVVANLDAKSTTANNPMTLNNHLHTLFAAIQSSYAGALGVPNLNTLYGPVLLRETEIVQGYQIIRDEQGKVIKKLPIKLKKETLDSILQSEEAEVQRVRGFEESLNGEGKFVFNEMVDDGSGKLNCVSTEYSLKFSEGEKKKLLESLVSDLAEKKQEALREFVRQNGVVTQNYEFEQESSTKVLRVLSKKEMRQIAQNLVFGASQSAFSRGGQTLFIDFNLDLSIPAHMQNVPALFLGAQYNRVTKNSSGEWEVVEKTSEEPPRLPLQEKPNIHKSYDVIQPTDGTEFVTYGHDLVKEASREFTRALFQVIKDGDKYGNMFNFPKIDVHVGRETFEDPESNKLLKEACEVVEKNDSIYFMYDRGDGMNVAQCCRLRERITDPYILKHPEKMRFCGFQNVTINLPRIGYEAKGNNLEEKVDSTLKEIDKMMMVVLKAHAEKAKEIQKSLDTDGAPLRAMGKPSDDGEPYIDLSKSTYILGFIGLNELVQTLNKKEMHEDPESFKLGLKILTHMYTKKNELSEKYKLKLVIEESPAESANRRLAKIDYIQYPEQAGKVLKGDIEGDQMYYTNSGHLSSSAPVSGIDRMVLQSKTNALVEAGTITHFFTGEKENKANAVYDIVKTGYYNTQSSQIAFSGEHTICQKCGRHSRGLHDKC